MNQSREEAERELVAYTRQQVRAGFLSEEALLAEVKGAVASEFPDVDPGIVARAWVLKAQADHRDEAAQWPVPSDYDRLQAAFEECAEHQVRVMQGVTGRQEVVETAHRLQSAGEQLRGAIWFTADQVRQAVDSGLLHLMVLHPDQRPAQPGDSLSTPVFTCLQRHGLEVKSASDGLWVRCAWQRRP